MPRPLGPFDRRRSRTSCIACSGLHLKCNGEYPCRSCISSGRPCVSEAGSQPLIRLGQAATKASNDTSRPSKLTLQNEECTSHFFDSYLPRNDFTARSSDEQQVLKTWMHKSAGLRNAIIAIGALDLTHHNQKRYLPIAVAYYKQAVSSLRVQLAVNKNLDDATLWTSLLLALFELMFDNTGTGFMLHFAQGLPALLKQRRFASRRMDSCRSLFRTVQMLETMRAASFWTYTQPTLVEDSDWQQIMQEMDSGLPEACDFAALYVLMGRFLTLNNMLSPIVLKVAPHEMHLQQQLQLASAATEGWELCHELEMWYPTQARSNFDVCTPILLLCSIYHCTLAITLVSIFNFPHFSHYGIHVPSSSAAKLNGQVDELCALLNSALRRTSLAGILLLWPLRVVGVKCVSTDQAFHILSMLREIEGRGFAVARSFEDVLMEKWRQKSLL